MHQATVGRCVMARTLIINATIVRVHKRVHVDGDRATTALLRQRSIRQHGSSHIAGVACVHAHG